MMKTYKIEQDGDILRIGFADPAQNDEIVKEVDTHLRQNPLPGGERVLINGPASLPVAVVLAHHLVHLYQEVGVFDPKMGGYVIVASHGGSPVGTVVKV